MNTVHSYHRIWRIEALWSFNALAITKPLSGKKGDGLCVMTWMAKCLAGGMESSGYKYICTIIPVLTQEHEDTASVVVSKDIPKTKTNVC